MAILALYALAFFGVWLLAMMAPWFVGRWFSLTAGKAAALVAFVGVVALWVLAWRSISSSMSPCPLGLAHQFEFS